ncbi:FRG domain-containing protein [Leifsonia lichenia]
MNSFDELNIVVSEIQSAHRGKLLWRGQEDARWGLHSSLFRTLAEKQGVQLVREFPGEIMYVDKQQFPDEDDLVEAERRTLEIARKDWRFDSLAALEILARVQHHGGPTRLIDFSFNPYIAAWFATASANSTDGRLFALATHGPAQNSSEPQVMLDEEWGGHRLPWHDWLTKERRNDHNWGNGSLRRFWVPPVYDSRMLAQNAVFIVEGVPISGMQIQSSFRKRNSPKSNDNWRMADLVASGSIYMKLLKPDEVNQSTARNLASTYTVRISAEGKESTRDRLQNLFGYSDSTIYPDIEGLCRHLAVNL